MTYSKHPKKGSQSKGGPTLREARGRKPKGYDKRIGNYINETIDEIREDRAKSIKERDRIVKEAKQAATEELRTEGQTGLVVPREQTEAAEYNKTKQFVFEKHMSIAPDVRFDHKGLYERNSKYTPSDKIAAVCAYMVTGNARKASLYCGVPKDTIGQWRKKDWWEALTHQVKKEKNDEMEAMITGFLHQGLEEVIERMHTGDTFYDTKTGNTYTMPVKLKELTTSLSMLFDKRQLLRGDPTRRVEQVSTDQRLSKLGKEFEKFSKAQTIDAEVVEDE